MMYILNNQEMKSIDRMAMDQFKIPGSVLMENAGHGIALHVLPMLKMSDKILVVCGEGNNGGDGFVIARHLINEGFDVMVFLMGHHDHLKGDTASNYKILMRMGYKVYEIPTLETYLPYDGHFMHADMIIDALFGTGLSRNLEPVALQCIERINLSKATVVSVDLPSGINGNTGEVMGLAVKADHTFAIDSYKYGNWFYPGVTHCGQLKVLPIGIPAMCHELLGCQTRLIDFSLAVAWMPKRPPNGHKGTFGKAVVIAGSLGLAGAAILTCQSALRTGLGLLKLIVPESLNQILKMSIPEVVTIPLPEMRKGVYGINHIHTIIDTCKGAQVIGIGPGCGETPELAETIHQLLETLEIPMVIDADGLNVLAKNKSWLKNIKGQVVLTPHIGEMSRLTGLPVEDILKNPVQVAQTYSKAWHAVVVLKDSRTVIATPEGRTYLNVTGNSGMGTAGSGDVLTGVITGLIAQGLTLEKAAVLGVYLHGYSGNEVAKQIGTFGLLAGDLVKQIALTMKTLNETSLVSWGNEHATY